MWWQLVLLMMNTIGQDECNWPAEWIGSIKKMSSHFFLWSSCLIHSSPLIFFFFDHRIVGSMAAYQSLNGLHVANYVIVPHERHHHPCPQLPFQFVSLGSVQMGPFHLRPNSFVCWC